VNIRIHLKTLGWSSSWLSLDPFVQLFKELILASILQQRGELVLLLRSNWLLVPALWLRMPEKCSFCHSVFGLQRALVFLRHTLLEKSDAKVSKIIENKELFALKILNRNKFFSSLRRIAAWI
jgi:hypothetical protein